MVMSGRRIAMGGTLLAATMIVGVWPAREGSAQTPDTAATSLVGAWTVNRELSDSPQDGSSDTTGGGSRGANRGGGGGGGFGGGRRRGGGGGFGGGGRGGQGTPAVDPEETARLRSAMRDILNPPDHLTIVQTENMVIITGPDGRATRLSPDGKKIKDDSTKVERKTKWDAAKLVSEISGLPGGKMTETWSVDPERRQLHIILKRDDDRRPLMVTRVYDADPK
jgi:hypothetical protein